MTGDDLETLYRRLGDDSRNARLPAAADLRRRGDRRAALRAAAGTGLVAVAVLAIALGGGSLLGRTGAAPPAGGPTPTAPAPTTPATPSVVTPAAIPGDVWFTAEDLGGTSAPVELDADLPEPCGIRLHDAAAGGPDGVAVTRTVGGEFRAPGTPDGYVPDGIVKQVVTVYRGSGAERALDRLRTMPEECLQERTSFGQTIWTLLPTMVEDRNQSVVVQRSVPAYSHETGEPTGGDPVYSYLVAVRSLDTVTLLWLDGWENTTLEPEDATRLGQLAAERLTAWREG